MKRDLCILLIAAIFIGGCSHKAVQPIFGEITIDTLIGGDPRTNVEYRFATILNADKSEALQRIEQSTVGYFFELEEFSGAAQAALTETLRQITEATTPLSPQHHEAADTTTAYLSVEAEGIVRDTLLTYIISRSSYSGGAHGMYSTESHLYSLNSGDELGLVDLFSDAQQQRMEQQLRANLYANYEVSSDDGLAERGFFPDYIALTENFQISRDSITFFYNPYEIGCYALGAVEVTIPLETKFKSKQMVH